MRTGCGNRITLGNASIHNGAMTFRRQVASFAVLACAAAAVLAGQSAAGDWTPLFDGVSLKGWKETPFRGRGTVEVKDGVIALGKGMLTGITWTGDFPKTNYEIRFEAVKYEGSDFFAGITFPVKDSHCSWINGGWGGTTVGLSSLDGNDASENETSVDRDFEHGRWYAFRLRVTDDKIQAWIDEKVIIDADIKGRRVDLRPGEIDLSAPLGFAAYSTSAGLRKMEYRKISDSAK